MTESSASSSIPRFERTDEGGRFPDSTYHPLVLANGVDAMQINLLGSGDAWWENCSYTAPLSQLCSPGWYKSDRRTHANTDLIYGNLIPLFEFASAPLLNGDQAVPRRVRQFFDPRRATLTTHYEQVSNEREDAWLRMCVTTFLTDDHVLVEHFEFIETPSTGAGMRFFINAPSEPHLQLYQRVVRMDEVSLEVEPDKSLMRYFYACGQHQGGAYSWFDALAESGEVSCDREKAFATGHLTSAAMVRGESFTRYLVCLDSEDDAAYRQALDVAVERCRRQGFAQIAEEHHAGWRQYFDVSAVGFPEAETAHLYDVGRYLARANLHPSGFMPMGNLPYQWQGVMFWDAGYAVLALLGSGNLAEARQVLEFILAFQPQARELAREFGAQGARLEWTFERKAFSRYPEPVEQVHNNSWWACIMATYCRSAEDKAFARKCIGFIGELLLFIRDRFIEDRGDHCVMARCVGIDESYSNPKYNDTWTCATTINALEAYAELGEWIDHPPCIEGIDQLADKLRKGLDRNIDADGVMQSFQGGRVPHWGSMIFDGFPDHPALHPTLNRMLQVYHEDLGVHNLHGGTRYAEKSFPWCHFQAARIFARVGDGRAHQLLIESLKFVNSFGGLPERVFYHGESFSHWFLTAHATMVWAVHGMLAHVSGRTLRILGGALPAWPTIRFEGIHAGAGLVVSAEVKAGTIARLLIKNLNQERTSIRCLLDREEVFAELKLKPGSNPIIV